MRKIDKSFKSRAQKPYNAHHTRLLSAVLKERQPDFSLCLHLIRNGADPEACNQEDSVTYTALMRAAQNDMVDFARDLINCGANINATNNRDYTALMWAAFLNNTDVALLLLDHGADVNVQGCEGRTALILAAEYGNVRLVDRLLECGANPMLKDQKGCTAQEAAQSYQHPALAETLQNAETRTAFLSACEKGTTRKRKIHRKPTTQQP
ncbi:MAG: ankyrin repeat domain-containing protein [Alphaproteobacteria bacterium]|nr:ankyrin repeat domain-containing protein [Alphaproteobacteria bacterium]